MSQFAEAMHDFREPKTAMVSGGRRPQDHSSDNGLLFSSAYLLMLRRQPDTGVAELGLGVTWFKNLVRSCYYPGNPGLLCRYPGWFGKTKEEQHDDYRGVMAACRAYGMVSVAQEILVHGESHRFCWNTEDPDTFFLDYCFDRFPGFTAALRGACNEDLSIGDQLSVLISCLAVLGQKKDDTTGTILQWCLCLSAEGKGWLSDLGIALWRALAQRRWPGGIAQVFGAYFARPDHPMAVFGQKDFR